MGLLLLLLGVVGLTLGLAGIVGCWAVRPSLTQKASRGCERAERLLAVAAESVNQIKASFEKARRNLAAVRAEATAPPSPQKTPAARRGALRLLAHDLTPQLERVRQTAGNVAESAVVLNTLLEGLNNLPFDHFAGIDTGQVNDVSEQVTTLTSAALRLEAMLGELPGEQANLEEVGVHAIRMDDRLSEAATRVGGLAERFAEAQARVADVHSNLQRWITLAAVALTALLFWVSLGQLSLLVHGWSWCRSRV
jgi:hypothetical protein